MLKSQRFPDTFTVTTELLRALPRTIPPEGLEVRFVSMDTGEHFLYIGPRPTPLGPFPAGYWGSGMLHLEDGLNLWVFASDLIDGAKRQYERGEYSRSNEAV